MRGITWADPEGDRGSGPPEKSQVIWVSIGKKALGPPVKSWTLPPGKCSTPTGT